jgi:hypothetical protein
MKNARNNEKVLSMVANLMASFFLRCSGVISGLYNATV